MPDEARLVAAFVLGLGVALAFTPVAIAVATRTGFLDRPVGWKSHHAPTPYLGGAVVLVAFALAAMMAGQDPARLTPIVVGAGGMWLVGTIDDRRPLPVSLRLGLEALIAAGLWICPHSSSQSIWRPSTQSAPDSAQCVAVTSVT